MKHNLVKKVVEFFETHPRESFKSRQVARRLSVHDEGEFQSLRDTLHSLVEEKRLSYSRRQGYRRRSPTQGMVGRLSIGRAGGTVEVAGFGSISVGQKSLGTAFDGDTVEVALFASGEGKRKGKPAEGEILNVISRAHSEFVGTLEQSKHFFFVVPDDGKIRRDIYIPSDALHGAKPGDKVLVALESWDSELLNPEGRIAEVIGKAGDASVEVRSVIKAFRLPTSFPKEVEHDVRKIPDTIPDEEFDRRLDLRSLVCFTIDPEDAKDFDDAISLESAEGGMYRLGVHIADVSAYVKEGSALDEEAMKRGTSVYLANQVVPMLPEKLSNDLCSLNPYLDRLAYSCFITITGNGLVKGYQISKSVIKSKRRFTYEEVERILDDGEGEYAEELTGLWSIARELTRKRMKAGSIDFDSREAKFIFDRHGKPVQIRIKPRLKSHRLVEECMLLANHIIAKYIGLVRREEDEHPFLYRVHDYPDMEKLRELSAFVEKFGHKLNVGSSVSSKSLQKLLNEVRDTPEENVINEVALRSMAKAIYSTENIGHYGLAFDHYTHFTSPIRRYPDLVVHRLLDEYSHGMSHTRRVHHGKRLPEICKWSSERERVAMEAERATVKVMQAEYMKQHLGDEFAGIISGVVSFGLFVEINDLLVEGMIHVRNLGDDYYLFDEKHYSLVGQRTRRTFRLGDTVSVRVANVNVENREIDFALAEKEAELPKGRKGRRSWS